MQLDPARTAEAREWLKRADVDLRAAAYELTADPPLTPDIVFHAQQLVEKSLKAFLAWNDVPFRKTHNLLELGKQCADIDVSLEPLLKRVSPLTEYAWKFRYPGEVEEPSFTEARDAFELAKKVHQEILSRLPGEISTW